MASTPQDPQHDDIEQEVRSYILREFLGGADPEELENGTPLITGGILDSISTVMLVSFLEDRYGVEFQAHEMDADHLDTVDRIAGTIRSKKG